MHLLHPRVNSCSLSYCCDSEQHLRRAAFIMCQEMYTVSQELQLDKRAKHKEQLNIYGLFTQIHTQTNIIKIHDIARG